MNDFRYALRTLRCSSGLAAVAITSLALGIGANTAIFSVTNAVILRSLPVPRPNELVLLRYVSKKGNIFDTFSYQEYLALRDAPEVLHGLAAVSAVEMNLASEEAIERVPGQLVSGNYFSLLGVRPRIGRLIQPDDDRNPGAHPVCVISGGLWQRRFGSASDVIGRKVEVNGKPYEILGVTPEGFDGTDQGTRAQVYVPLMMAAQVLTRPTNSKVQPPFLEWTDWLKFVGRLKPGVTIARAQAVLDARFAQLPLAHRNSTFEMSTRHGVPGERARLRNLRFEGHFPVWCCDVERGLYDDRCAGQYRRRYQPVQFVPVLYRKRGDAAVLCPVDPQRRGDILANAPDQRHGLEFRQQEQLQSVHLYEHRRLGVPVGTGSGHHRQRHWHQRLDPGGPPDRVEGRLLTESGEPGFRRLLKASPRRTLKISGWP